MAGLAIFAEVTILRMVSCSCDWLRNMPDDPLLPPAKPAFGRAKQVFLALLKFAIPAGIIGYLLWNIKPEQWEQLTTQPKNYPLLVGALLVALAAMCLSFARWCILVRCQGIPLSMLEAFRLSAIGFLLSFVSAGSVGGDLFKAIFLARRSPGKRVEAVASVFVDRGSGLFGLLTIGCLALLLTVPATGGEDAARLQSMGRAATTLLAVGTAILAVLILGGKPIDRLIHWSESLPAIGKVVRRVAEPLRAFHSHPWGFLVSLVMSIAVQGMMAISLYLICLGMYSESANPPTLIEHFVIVPVGLLASALPIAPAGMGVFEAAVEWMYQVVPATPTEASGTLVALVFEIVKIVMAVIGVAFYWTAGREIRRSLEVAEEAGEAAIEGE